MAGLDRQGLEALVKEHPEGVSVIVTDVRSTREVTVLRVRNAEPLSAYERNALYVLECREVEVFPITRLHDIQAR